MWTRPSGKSLIGDSSGWSPIVTGKACPWEIGFPLCATRVWPHTPSKGCDWMLQKDLKELLLAFNEHGVEYLVVGGYAVGVHSEPRATKDLDIFIRPDLKNSEAVFRALKAYGAPLDGLSASDFRNEPGAVFQIGLPPFRIDILQAIDGVAFDDAWSARVEGFVEGEVPAHVISREHLIQNKLASGRPQDLADVSAMREANPE